MIIMIIIMITVIVMLKPRPPGRDCDGQPGPRVRGRRRPGAIESETPSEWSCHEMMQDFR
jgi:hypothetical protein